jgi:hypothetical protein
MVIAVADDQAASKGACLRLFDRFDHHNKQFYIYMNQARNVGRPCTTNKLSASHGGSGRPVHADCTISRAVDDQSISAIGDAEALLLFGYESSSRFSGTGMIDVDFTNQTANVREIDPRDNNMHSLRSSMAFQISNRTNSFLDENTTMMLRLDQQSENS